jgi:hypothetical protein
MQEYPLQEYPRRVHDLTKAVFDNHGGVQAFPGGFSTIRGAFVPGRIVLIGHFPGSGPITPESLEGYPEARGQEANRVALEGYTNEVVDQLRLMLPEQHHVANETWLTPFKGINGLGCFKNIAIEHGVQMVRDLLSFHPCFVVVYVKDAYKTLVAHMGATSNTVEETEGLVEFFTVEDDGYCTIVFGIPIMKYMKNRNAKIAKVLAYLTAQLPP